MMPQHYTARDRETGRKSRSGPLATANGYRPADGWGVVDQAWQSGKTGILLIGHEEWQRITQADGTRWAAIGRTDLQQGLMALTRAVAQQTTF